ncbi:hypothetical protein [Aeromonas sp. R7-5]|uniref:hypothetical protein n=1 Tax=Aeromonas sp. R7-5 TaxID=3138477 RepID=UPI0034A13081
MPTDPLAQRLRLAIVLGLLLLVGLTALNLLQAASGLRKDNARSLNHARAMIESAINDSQSLVKAAVARRVFRSKKASELITGSCDQFTRRMWGKDLFRSKLRKSKNNQW